MTEEKDLQRFSDIVQMSKSSAWIDWRDTVTAWMTEAYDKMMGAELASDQMLAAYARAYIHRTKLKREMDGFIESATKGFDEITEQMRRDLESANEVTFQ